VRLHVEEEVVVLVWKVCYELEARAVPVVDAALPLVGKDVERDAKGILPGGEDASPPLGPYEGEDVDGETSKQFEPRRAHVV
jgi:hypothetical protein